MLRTQIARQLWSKLWEDYRCRVEYARVYQQMIQEAGGAIANDHIAFRSLGITINSSSGLINLGIPYLADIAHRLGYEVADEYEFPEQHLRAQHYRHPAQDEEGLPKLFISELVVEALPAHLVSQIQETVETGLFNIKTYLGEKKIVSTAAEVESITAQLRAVFTRPWQPPKRSVVEAVNAHTQYGAWVLLHGYAVNHFTGYVNGQNTPHYPDIESTARALEARGVPMKAVIEGSKETGLRQTATQAVTEMVSVRNDLTNELEKISWPYAYYEIAERYWVEIAPGKRALFEGFLNSQARNLFEMTRKVS